MAKHPGDNIQIWNSQDFDQLIRWASMEQAADNVLWVRKFGKTPTLTANVTEDIWQYGGERELPYVAGEQMVVSSSSASDTAAGIGAQSIIIYGLDTNYDFAKEEIILNGTSSVNSVRTDFITIDRIRVSQSGSNQANVGDITVSGATSSNVNAFAPAGESTSQQSHFTIPRGYTLFMVDASSFIYRNVGSSGARSGEIDFVRYNPATNTKYQTTRTGADYRSGQQFSTRLVQPFSEKQTLWARVTADNNTSGVSVAYGYLLVKGNYDLVTEI